MREVVEAKRLTDRQIPQTVDDPAWQTADRFYVPLVGQIVLRPRWFSPRVDGIWVQSLHDGQDVALLVSWTDPSESPDPVWTEYAQQIIETMGPGDEGAATEPGGPDQLVVQFPQALARGMERPYFLQGDTRRPAYTWTWRSGVVGAIESTARGLGTAAPHGEQHLRAASQYTDGQWKVLILRALDKAGDEDLAFPVGQPVPMAFQVWDGDNGESGNQGAVSTWYFLFLQQPTPVAVYVAPPVALALTLLLGRICGPASPALGRGKGARGSRRSRTFGRREHLDRRRRHEMSDRSFAGRHAPLVVALFALAGCGGGESGGAASGGGDAAPMESPVDAATAGHVSAAVTFSGTAPVMAEIDMASEATCAAKHTTTPMEESFVAGAGGGLANVFVYVKEGLESLQFPTPTSAVVLDQDGCLYQPHVLGLQVDQDLTIRNSDGLLHNINATPTENRGFKTGASRSSWIPTNRSPWRK